MPLEPAPLMLWVPLASLGCPRTSRTFLRHLLGGLAAIGRFGNEQSVRRIVVSLPIPVLHHQHLHAAQPASEVLPTLDPMSVT